MMKRAYTGRLCYAYDRGSARNQKPGCQSHAYGKYIDPERFRDVLIPVEDSDMWRSVLERYCLLYLQQFSKQPIPYELERQCMNEDMMEYKLNITNFECPPYGFTR